ncbi:hypothetical protein ORV05_04850 [Amycolatopsis cynarae]|uniref:Uncharacterized protein n=1 Tax=Amycolatopsis cynarae TaxID=2995223 RepID=A0ABY7B482_9PSEU|nr:hypothetical protein [Amycolatopsis sp. HUAS 11-8]WAL67120.1 hypothetical protein ORV05_04850 [Amycolatopsis sp. HUAS 11-8]
MHYVIEARTLFESERVSVIAAMHPDEDTRPTDYDCHDADEIARFESCEWDYVGMAVRVMVDGAQVAEESLWAIAHGAVSEDTKADAWELTPATYPEPNVVQMGSPLSGVVCEALDAAYQWLIKVEAGPEVRQAVRAAQRWADPNARRIAPRVA